VTRVVLLALVIAGCGATTQTSTTPDSPERVDGAVLVQLARGERAWSSVIDPRIGLARVEVFGDASGEDPRADADGTVHIAERLCGEALERYLETLTADLRLRVETSWHDPLFVCTATECRFDAEMEFDRSGRIELASSGASIVAIERVEGGTVAESWLAEANAWVREAHARLPRACD
jgi:hypothetical protein